MAHIQYCKDQEICRKAFGARREGKMLILARKLGKRLGRAGIACHRMKTLTSSRNANRIAHALRWPVEHVRFAQQTLRKLFKKRLRVTVRYDPLVFVDTRSRVPPYVLADNELRRMWHARLDGTSDAAFRYLYATCPRNLAHLWERARDTGLDVHSPAFALARRRAQAYKEYALWRLGESLLPSPVIREELMTMTRIAMTDPTLWHTSSLVFS